MLNASDAQDRMEEERDLYRTLDTCRVHIVGSKVNRVPGEVELEIVAEGTSEVIEITYDTDVDLTAAQAAKLGYTLHEQGKFVKLNPDLWDLIYQCKYQ